MAPSGIQTHDLLVTSHVLCRCATTSAIPMNVSQTVKDKRPNPETL